MITLDVTHDRGFPEFYSPIAQKPELTRLYGSEMDTKSGIFRYPAYWPLCFYVEHDAKVLFDESPFSPAAIAELEKQRELLNNYKQRKFPVEVPEDFFYLTPYQHQLDGISLGTNCLRSGWAFDPGTGKTKTAIDAFRIRRLSDPDMKLLVIAPPVTMFNWLREIEMHSFGQLTGGLFWDKHRAKCLDQNPDIVVTTYQTMGAYLDELKAYGFGGIIADESQRMRNWSSQLAKNAVKFSKGIPWRVIMSGTPAFGDPRHWYPQLCFLSKQAHPEGSFTNFQQRFVKQSRNSHYGTEGYKNMEALKRRVNSMVLFRKKEDCLDLPPRTVIDIRVPMSREIRRIYNSFVKEYKAEVNGSTIELPTETILSQIQPLLQVTRGWVNESQKDPNICDGCEHMHNCVRDEIRPYTRNCQVVQKAPPPITHTIEDSPILSHTVELLSDILDANPTNKALVWFRSNETLRRTAKMFVDYRQEHVAEPRDTFSQEHVVMTGGSNFQAVVDKINNDPYCRVLFGQIKCGIGVNMTAANYTIYPEVSLSIEDMEQSDGRNHRSGQTRPVTVYRFLAEGALDEGAMAIMEQKEAIEDAISDPNFCKRCEEAGECILSLKKGATCALQTFIQRSKLRVGELDENELDENDDDDLAEEITSAPAGKTDHGASGGFLDSFDDDNTWVF